MNDRILSIALNLEEWNLLLTALAECPFKTVFELIGKLNQQAQLHCAEVVDRSGLIPFTLTEQEMALAIGALEKLPYEHVHQLLANLNRQMKSQSRPDGDQSAQTAKKTYADF